MVKGPWAEYCSNMQPFPGKPKAQQGYLHCNMRIKRNLSVHTGLPPCCLGILRVHVCDRAFAGVRVLPEGSLRQGTVSKPSLFRQGLPKLRIQAAATGSLHVEATVCTRLMQALVQLPT